MARPWFEVMRGCGDEVREVLHDGCPNACLGDVPFGYVNVFRSHGNVGFFQGARLRDPEGLLQGEGKFMRHVKLRPGAAVDAGALTGVDWAGVRGDEGAGGERLGRWGHAERKRPERVLGPFAERENGSG